MAREARNSVCAPAIVVACRPAGSATDYRSPKGLYTVSRLVGPKTAPKVPLVEHIVYARAYKGAEVLIDNWEVHFADFFDTSFDARFAGADWPGENVLRRHWLAPPAEMVAFQTTSLSLRTTPDATFDF